MFHLLSQSRLTKNSAAVLRGSDQHAQQVRSPAPQSKQLFTVLVFLYTVDTEAHFSELYGSDIMNLM